MALSPRSYARSTLTVLLLGGAVGACSSGGAGRAEGPVPDSSRVGTGRGMVLPALPDSLGGFGPHVLALETSPNGELWVGTHGDGIYVLRPRAREWEHIVAGDSGLVSGYVNSIAFGDDEKEVWYGTIGSGYGVSRDGGRSWRHWGFGELGAEFQYVAPDGIRRHEDQVYIATADGLRIGRADGSSWTCLGAVGGVPGGTAERPTACTERRSALPSEYLLALDVTEDGDVWVGHLRGLSFSTDDGRTWKSATGPALPARVRDVLATAEGVWALTEQHLLRDSTREGAFGTEDPELPGWGGWPGAPRTLVPGPGAELMPTERQRGMVPPRVRRPMAVLATRRIPTVLTSFGAVVSEPGTAPVVQFLAAAERFRPAGDLWAGQVLVSRTVAGSTSGLQRVLAGEAPRQAAVAAALPAAAEAPRHAWFRRPVPDTGANPYIDGTYRYGSTMGGTLQQHQGVEFNNPAGTPVLAADAGLVVFAGPAEGGALTVAIRHERQWEGQHVFTTYYHNSSLAVRPGDRVQAGQVIARVGNTGRATNDHLHFEVHVAPSPDSAAIVNPAERFPAFTRNPQLWLEPIAGTGVVVGRVLNAAGQPVPSARVYGLVVGYPEETPFSFAETYGDRAHPDPAYDEHFAVGDVAPGNYLLGALIDGQIVWRRARVAAGMVTSVEFRAGT